MELPAATSAGSSAPPATRTTRIAQTASYYGAFIALGLVAAVLGPTLPSLAEHTHTQLQTISVLFTLRAMGYLLGSIQSGIVYDRYRGNPIMAAVLLCIAVSMALVPVVTLLWAIIVVFLIIGVAEGMVDVGGNTLLVWVHREQVGPYMNGLHFCFGVGAFLAPIIVAQVVELGGASLSSYWVLAALTVPAAAGLLWLPSPVAQHAAHDDSPASVNYGLVALIAMFFVLYVGAEVGFGGWVFSYAEALKLTDTTTAAYLTSAFWGALTLGRFLAIPIAARLRPRTILLGDLIGCVVSVGGIVLWPTSLAALWLGTLGLGLSMASIFPTTLSFAARRMPTTGKITSAFLVGASLGAMSLPWLIGQLFESLGPQVTMIVILVDLLATCAVFALLMYYAGRPITRDET